jgi:hypothetical protein
MSLTEADMEAPQPASANARCLRRFPRRSICLLGRYTGGAAREYPCQTLNLSAGGVALFAPAPGRPGDRIALYIDQIGRLEGGILRVSRCGFVLQFSSLTTSARVQRFLDGL